MASSADHEAGIDSLNVKLTAQRSELVEAVSSGWPAMTSGLAKRAFENNPAISDLLTDDQLRTMKQSIASLNKGAEAQIRADLFDLLAEPELGHDNIAYYPTETEERIGEFLNPLLADFRVILASAELPVRDTPAGHTLNRSRGTDVTPPMGDRFQKAVREYVRVLALIANQRALLAEALLAEGTQRAAERWESID